MHQRTAPKSADRISIAARKQPHTWHLDFRRYLTDSKRRRQIALSRVDAALKVSIDNHVLWKTRRVRQEFLPVVITTMLDLVRSSS